MSVAHHRLALLPIAALVALGGCYANPVNGEDGHFAFAGPPAAAAGHTVRLLVVHDQRRLALCGVTACADLLPDRAPDIATVDSADCDVPECEVQAAPTGSGAVALSVRCPRAARPRLHLATHLVDGTAMEDHITVPFLDPARIALRVEAPRRSGAVSALFAGADVTYLATVESTDGTRLQVDELAANVEGDPVVLTGQPYGLGPSGDGWVGPLHFGGDDLYPGFAVPCRTVRAGRATLRVAAAGLERAQGIRVADPADVVDAALVSPASVEALRDGKHHFLEVNDEPVTPVPIERLTTKVANYYVDVLLTLSDGSHAFGGADYFTVDGAALFVPPIAEPSPAPFSLRLIPQKKGTATLRFTMGTAHREWPVTVTAD